MGPHVGEPQRPRAVDQHAEHAAPARQVADRPVRVLVDPRGEKPLEAFALVVEYADRGVARAGQLTRALEQALEHSFGIEHGYQRPANSNQPPQTNARPTQMPLHERVGKERYSIHLRVSVKKACLPRAPPSSPSAAAPMPAARCRR